MDRLIEDTDFDFLAHPSCEQFDPPPNDVIHRRLERTLRLIAALPAASIVQALDTLDRALQADCVGAISAEVARAMRVDHGAVLGKARTQRLAFCRQVTMFLCRKITGAPFECIGDHLGGRHHSTVIYACQLIERRMVRDGAFRLFIEKLRRQITETVPTTEAAA